MTDDIAAQLGSFEYDNQQQLERVEDKIDAIAKAVGVPAPEKTVEPLPPLSAFEEVVSAPVIAAEAVPPIPPVAEPETEGQAPASFLGGIAHHVADFAKGAVGGLRSDDVDALGNPDGGITPAEAVEAAAIRSPVGPHTQAVEERRAQPAPALVVAG
jgi:hypothetical protein